MDLEYEQYVEKFKDKGLDGSEIYQIFKRLRKATSHTEFTGKISNINNHKRWIIPDYLTIREISDINKSILQELSNGSWDTLGVFDKNKFNVDMNKRKIYLLDTLEECCISFGKETSKQVFQILKYKGDDLS